MALSLVIELGCLSPYLQDIVLLLDCDGFLLSEKGGDIGLG